MPLQSATSAQKAPLRLTLTRPNKLNLDAGHTIEDGMGVDLADYDP